MDIQFGHLASVNYLWLVLLVVATIGVAVVARRRAAERFATANLVGAVLPTRKRRTFWSMQVLSVAALVSLVVGLADIRWGKTWREVPQKGIEVIFALDVSRSMLAEDVTPNRLSRAKQQIKDIVDEMAGDRVGLVAFAGEAKRMIPLTSHYHDFKQTLDEVGQHDVTRGGSNLGDAVQVAADSFLGKTSDHKAIVLFTDGEDHESHPIEAAKRAHTNQGIRIFTIGLGDDQQGARVPVTSNHSSYLQHDGQQVWSKLDGPVLEAMALASDGAYIPAGVKQVDMAQVYRKYVAQVERQDFETARINSYIPRFQWFLGLAFAFTLLESLLGLSPLWNRWPAPRGDANGQNGNGIEQNVLGSNDAIHTLVGSSSNEASGSRSNRRPVLGTAGSAAAVLAFCILHATTTRAAETDAMSLANRAGKAFQEGHFEAAADQYREASVDAPDRLELKYNEAVARYRQGDHGVARALFIEATASSNRQLESMARFNLGNCDYAEALSLATDDRQGAIDKALSAVSHYRGAIEANQSDADARANIELANLLIRKLREENQNDKTKSEQDRNQQDQQNQDAQSDQNGSQGQQPQNSSSHDESTSDNSQSHDSRGKGQEKQQDDTHESSEEQSRHESSPDSQVSDDAPADHSPSDPSSSGQSDSDKPDSDMPDSAEQTPEESVSMANPSNPDPSSQLNHREQTDPTTEEPIDAAETSTNRPPDGRLQASSPSNDGRPNDDLSASSEADSDVGAVDPSKPMTREEAMKMLQSVRDRDLMRRIQKSRQARRQYVPGEKDW